MDLAPRPIGRPRSCSCGTCPKCKHADYMRRWYQSKTVEERRAWIALRDPERVAQHEKARSATPRKRASLDRSVARHPEKFAARRAVHSAIAGGRLTRLPCWCGNPRSEAHHPDYSRPLDVEWLRRRHHADRHMELKAA